MGTRRDTQVWRRKGSDIWYFYHYTDTGKRIARSTGKTVKYQAQQEMRKFLSKPLGSDIPFGTYAEGYFKWATCEWIKRQHARGKSFSEAVANMRRGHLKNYILPRFKDTPLSSMNALDIEKWLVSITKTNQTKKHILASLRPILRDAERQGLIPFNPAEKVEALPQTAKSRDTFTTQELAKLFPADEAELLKVWGSHKYAAAFLMLASTGLRSGELRALRWEDVDLMGKFVTISHALKADDLDGPTKTGASRLVIVPNRTAATLGLYSDQKDTPSPGSLVFPARRRSTPMHRDTLRSVLADALIHAKVLTDGRNLVVHSFRHSYVTLLRSTLPETTLRLLTGHSSERMTDHYDHLDVKDRAAKLQPHAAAVDGAFAFRDRRP
jgi:integrase